MFPVGCAPVSGDSSAGSVKCVTPSLSRETKKQPVGVNILCFSKICNDWNDCVACVPELAWFGSSERITLETTRRGQSSSTRISDWTLALRGAVQTSEGGSVPLALGLDLSSECSLYTKLELSPRHKPVSSQELLLLCQNATLATFLPFYLMIVPNYVP